MWGNRSVRYHKKKVKENAERERWTKGSKGTNCAWVVVTKVSYPSVLPV